jgi:hypothetical protein
MASGQTDTDNAVEAIAMTSVGCHKSLLVQCVAKQSRVMRGHEQ